MIGKREGGESREIWGQMKSVRGDREEEIGERAKGGKMGEREREREGGEEVGESRGIDRETGGRIIARIWRLWREIERERESEKEN